MRKISRTGNLNVAFFSIVKPGSVVNCIKVLPLLFSIYPLRLISNYLLKPRGCILHSTLAMKLIFRSALYLFFSFTACDNDRATHGTGNPDGTNSSVPLINYAVINTYPHDTTSFTEGLLVHDGLIFESTGSPEDMMQTRSLFG